MRSQITSIFFKEYNCLDFTYPLGNAQSYTFSLTFQQSQGNKFQPSIFIDTIRHQNELYFLQWYHEKQYHLLFVRSISTQQWISIRMNLMPQHVHITDDRVFLTGSKQIHIISLVEEGQVMFIQPYSEEIVSIDICYTSRNQPGLSVVHFSPRKGYFKEEYSKSYQKGIFSKLPSLSSIFSKTQQKYTYFKVIIPNLLALAFPDDSTAQLYDIHNGQLTNILLKLEGWQFSEEPIIRIRSQQKDNRKDTFMLFIGGQNKIQFCYLEISKRNEIIEQFQKKGKSVNICEVASGNVIDWQHTRLTRFIVIGTQGRSILDYQVSNAGLVYFSSQGRTGQIPKCVYIPLQYPYISHPILTWQQPIWHQFLNDSKKGSQIDKDKLFGTGRYPIEMTNRVSPNIKTQYLAKNLLYGWRQNYRFIGLIVYNQQLLIVRKNCLSSIHEIPQHQFKLEQITQQQKNLLELPFISNQRQLSEVLSSDFNNYNSDISNNIQKYTSPMERRYTDFKPLPTSHNAGEQTSNIFNQFYNQFHKKLVTQNLKSLYKTSLIPQFRKKTLTQLLKDKLNFFCNIFNTHRFYLPIDSYQGQLQNNQYEQTSYLIKLLNYFNSLTNFPISYIQSFQADLITMFINWSSEDLSEDVDRDLAMIVQQLFRGLIVRQQSVVSHKCPIIEFMTQQINKTDNKPQKQILEKHLKELILLLFTQKYVKSHSKILHNETIIRALPHLHLQEQQIQQIFSRYSQSKFFNQMASTLQEQSLYKNQIFENLLKWVSVNGQITMVKKPGIKFKKAHNSQNSQLDEENQDIQAKIINKVMVSNAKMSKKHPFEDEQMENINNQLKGISQNFSKIQSIRDMYNRMLKRQKYHQNYEKILQLQESMLIYCTQAIDSLFIVLEGGQNFTESQQILFEYINIVQICFQNYKYYFQLVYSQQQKEQSFDDLLAKDQALMSSNFLAAPIKIKGILLSSTWIKMLNIITNQEHQQFIYHPLNFVQFIISNYIDQQNFDEQSLNNLNFLCSRFDKSLVNSAFQSFEDETIQKLELQVTQRSHKNLYKILKSLTIK